MKWLKKLLHKHQLKELKRECVSASPFKANRALCHKLLLSLSEEGFLNYDPAQTSGICLRLQYADMEQLIDKIIQSISLVRHEKMIPPDWSSNPEKDVSLDRFISTQSGHYAKPATSIRRFKKHALELCEIMEISDTETVGLPEHNLRMLTKLFTDIRTVALTMLEVSGS